MTTPDTVNEYGEPALSAALTEAEHRDLCVWLHRIQHATPCTLGARLLTLAKKEAYIVARGVGLDALGAEEERLSVIWATAMVTAPIELRHLCVHVVNEHQNQRGTGG